MSEYEPPMDRGKVFTWFGFEMRKWYRTFAWFPVYLSSGKGSQEDRLVWLRRVCVKYTWNVYFDSEGSSHEFRPYDPNVKEWRWAPIGTKGLVRTIMFFATLFLIISHIAVFCNGGS